jgi:hypothetical protein
MRLVTLEEKLPNRGVIRLHHLTDLHLGAPDVDEHGLRERVGLIAQDPQARWTMGGDGGDLIRHNDRRYQPTELHPRYRQATDIRLATREHLAELLDPIKGKCWGWADGNHERAMDEHFGGKFGVEVCCDLNVESRYVGYRGLVHVAVTLSASSRMALLLDLQHGWQAGRLKGAPMVQAERELGMTEADVVLRGHNHSPAAHVFATLGVSGHGRDGERHIVKRLRTVVNGGTWRTGYRADLAPVNRNRISEVEGDLWQETKGYRAEPVGGPVLILRFDKGAGVNGRGDGARRPASIEHTIIEGTVTAETLGL